MGNWEIKELAWLMLAIKNNISLKSLEHLTKVYPKIEDWYLDRGKTMKKYPGLTEKDREKWLITEEWMEETRSAQEKMKKAKIRFVSREHPDFPERLKNMYDCPKGLFYKGKLPKNGTPSAAIVGARNCSYYGKTAAEKIAAVLAEAGVDIISGLAYGIDAHAHQGALLGKGVTYAVMGAGVEECYPKEHYYIYEEILKNGGVMSEQPMETPVRPYLFPVRNRIISALSDCVVVIEAREKSGSLITADQALEQGKDVFALPGRMYDDLSFGCNRLIQSGAEIITGPEDLLRYFNLEGKKKEKEEMTDPFMQYFSMEPIYIQELLERTGEPLSVLSGKLLSLELAGLVEQPYPNYYVKTTG